MNGETVENPDGEDYANAAAASMAAGDLVQAMNLIAAALTFNPTREDWLQVVDTIVECTTEPLTLAQVEEPAFFGLLAVRGLLLAKQGRHAEALALHLDVVSFRPDVPYLRWANTYAKGAALTENDLTLVGPKLSAFTRTITQSLADDAPERHNVVAALAIVRTLRNSFTTHAQLAFFEGLLLRKLCRFEEARQVAMHDLERLPSWFTAVGAAASCRMLGQLDDAIHCYRMALQFEPMDAATQVDIGDILLNDERYSEAQAAYEVALSIESEQPWAQASLLFIQYRLSGNSTFLSQLQALAARGNERALALLSK